MLLRSSLLDNAFDRESAPLQNFAQRFYYTACLVKPDIERPWGGAGAYDDCFLAFMQRLGDKLPDLAQLAIPDLQRIFQVLHDPIIRHAKHLLWGQAFGACPLCSDNLASSAGDKGFTLFRWSIY